MDPRSDRPFKDYRSQGEPLTHAMVEKSRVFEYTDINHDPEADPSVLTNTIELAQHRNQNKTDVVT